ncbi:MAG: hypothetical protein KF784_10510 [Fimbriimonadaceae bacterium]|nr:hypothetical protein [Fimbriimonadaceae bacterium]
MNSFTLTVPNLELDFVRCITSGQVFRWEQLEDGRWLGVDGPHWYLVRLSTVGENTQHEVESNATQQDFERFFQLGHPLPEILTSILENGPELKPYLALLGGLRVLRCSDPEEVLFSFLCSANNNLHRIVPMVRALASYGEPLRDYPTPCTPSPSVLRTDEEVAKSDRLSAISDLNFDNLTLNTQHSTLTRFPTPDRIAAIPESELRAKGFGYRAATIPHVAQQLLERPTGWLESLKGASYKEAHAELCRFKGIGPKLADCIALFGLHFQQATPIDTHMWQAVTRLYRPEWAGKSVTDARYKEAGQILRERCGPWAGWAHQYLFLENLLNWRERRK